MEIKAENQTLATITLQNYFRLYDKLSGMTGTAETEAAELHQTYTLGVIPIPTNRPMVRVDNGDLIYKTEEAKFDAVVDDVVERHENGQPVLIGTTSVERSEYLSKQFTKRGRCPQRPQRQVPREGSDHHRRGRSLRRGHRRDQTWPAAVPTSCSVVTRDIIADIAPAQEGPRPGHDAGRVRGSLGRSPGRGQG